MSRSNDSVHLELSSGLPLPLSLPLINTLYTPGPVFFYSSLYPVSWSTGERENFYIIILQMSDSDLFFLVTTVYFTLRFLLLFFSFLFYFVCICRCSIFYLLFPSFLFVNIFLIFIDNYNFYHDGRKTFERLEMKLL